MSVQLEIHDGTPWWVSTDIWTVPGNDPEGAQGLPIVGTPCYVWARVTNNGTDTVTDATVRFYWANPSVGFDRNTANHIGNANATLNPGETQDVLCLVPWMPTFVNGGHECVLAEAFHQSQDPLPATPDFNVPTDRHVAQRNLSVVMAAMKSGRFAMSFEVHNPQRIARTFVLKTELGRLEEVKPLLGTIGRAIPTSKGAIKEAGFIATANPCDSDEKPQPTIKEFTVGPGARNGLTITGTLEGEAALLHVTQEADGKNVGGLSVLVVRGNQQVNKGRA